VGNLLTLHIQGSRLLEWHLVRATIGDWGQPSLG
jgi:hypothetical protein